MLQERISAWDPGIDSNLIEAYCILVELSRVREEAAFGLFQAVFQAGEKNKERIWMKKEPQSTI